MKKIKYHILIISLFAFVLTSCENNGGINSTAAGDTPSTGISDRETVSQPTEAVTQTEAEIQKEQDIQVSIKNIPPDPDSPTEISVEYVEISGMKDAEIQDELNENLKTFSLWYVSGLSQEENNKTVTASYALIDNYICVYAELLETGDSLPYPIKRFDATTYDLETGLNCTLSEFIDVKTDLITAIENGSFSQVYPETAVEGALDVLLEEASANPNGIGFYLKPDIIGLYLNDRLHAEGDYWLFEANLNDI